MKVIEGQLSAKGLKFGIIVGRFNEFISSKLLGGALDALKRSGAIENDIEMAWSPGSFEIPLIAKKMAKAKKYDAIICLGAVIRGATPHFDFVANEVSKGVASAMLETEVPIIFGVLTTESIEQAKSGNKGFDAAMAAIEMANLMKEI